MKLSVSFLLVASLQLVSAWSVPKSTRPPSTALPATKGRRSFLTTAAVSTASWLSVNQVVFADGEDDFTSIAARAAKISQAMESEQPQSQNTFKSTDTRTIYDFSLPIAGEGANIGSLVQKDIVKAILVVNIKQDDPIARKNIPELIALASKFGRNGEFSVICCPTDQGYYEPDTSALIRLKLASEYGYGINPATILTDKVNLLGTGAHPFWRWLEGSCRTPSGLGKIQADFEKFLVDGTTGLPLRRYPRKYLPHDIQDDIAALLAGKPLPPAGSNYLEEWRTAANDSERDTYRFQKGLNVFDQ